jgi:hypothetical protein
MLRALSLHASVPVSVSMIAATPLGAAP